MSILNQLSSQTGDNTEESNRKVVDQCLKNPDLLKEIAEGLKSDNQALVGDCAEAFTKVAEEKPELIVRFADNLIPLLDHKYTRARWEAMHALALIADRIPKAISPIISQLHRMSLSDQSTIVRDYAAIAVGNYAKASKRAADEAFPVLQRILEVWKEKQAARILKGLHNVAESNPSLTDEILSLAKVYENSPKGSIKKAAKEIIKALQK